jgi:ankyrin repeat protein
VNIKNLDKIEFEDLQNCFPVLPLIPEITSSDLLRYLSQDKRMNINFVCPLNKGTALLSAVYSGNFDIIKDLVEQGANTDYVNENGESAFVTKHTLSMIQYFLKLGANINQNGNRGTPLLFATRFGNVEAVEFLIKNEANVNLEPWEIIKHL